MTQVSRLVPLLEVVAFLALIAGLQPMPRLRAASLLLPAISLAAAVVAVAQARWQALPLAVVAAAVLGFALAATCRDRGHWPHALRWRLVAVLVVVLAAVPIYLFPIPRLPDPSGPFAVGTSVADWSHEFPDGTRRLKIRLWYPATADSTMSVGTYLEPSEASGTIATIARFASMPAWAYSYFALTRTHGRTDAAPAEGESFPLVLFSHGYWFYTAQNTALMELLAANGYIVASVAYPGDSAPVAFSDGTVIETIPHEEEAPSPGMRTFFESASHTERLAAYPRFQEEIQDHRILASLATWRETLLAVLDDLESMATTGMARTVSKRADFSRVAFVGMSFGGCVSASTCAADPRCKAAVNMDGFEYDAAMFDRRIERPLLMLQSDWVGYRIGDRPVDPEFHENDYFYERHEEAGTAGQVYRARVALLRHLGFTDLPLGLRQPVRAGFVGALDSSVAIRSVNETVRRFLDRYLRGDEVAFSAATIEETPALSLHDARGVRNAVTGR